MNVPLCNHILNVLFFLFFFFSRNMEENVFSKREKNIVSLQITLVTNKLLRIKDSFVLKYSFDFKISNS